MNRGSIRTHWKQIRIPTFIFTTLIGMEFGIWGALGGNHFKVGVQVAYWLMGTLLALSAAWLTALLKQQHGKQASDHQNSPIEQTEHDDLRLRLDALVQLNQLTLTARNENELVEKSLEIITRVAGSSGSSFVPFDEWGQPLQAFIYGTGKPPAQKQIIEYLTTPVVMQRCASCTKLGTEILHNCPLLDGPFQGGKKIYCMPLTRNGHSVGVVNLHLPLACEISTEVREFLDMLLNEMALALEITRLRSQEIMTLHQLQLANGQPEDLELIIKRLIEGLRDTLDFKNTRAVFRPAEPRFAGFELASGTDPWLDSNQAGEILRQAANQGCVTDESIQLQHRADGSGLLILPFSLPEGTIIGAVLMTGGYSNPLNSQQRALIDTVTTQAALMVENERRRLETEYRTVIQERMRLAREIHDSLAQTLAYLKLTSAQMQSQLAQGDLDRLALNLQHSHQALSDAYLETRQAIDNLRFAPQQDMVSWLGQVIHNFEVTSGMKTVTNTPATLAQVSPEVQAQLVRIVQEALSNIRRHAQAANVNIKVREWNNNLVFDIMDDGVGFSSEDLPDLSRHGLRGMRERAELIGAEFQITSQAGRGTTIHIEVPIHTQETPA